MGYQIHTKMYGGEWECPEEFPTTYATKEEASKELEEFIKDCQKDCSLGYLDDFNPEDWAIFEVIGEKNETN